MNYLSTAQVFKSNALQAGQAFILFNFSLFFFSLTCHFVPTLTYLNTLALTHSHSHSQARQQHFKLIGTTISLQKHQANG